MALAVPRQDQDRRKLAESMGWIIDDEHVDIDVSAFSGNEPPRVKVPATIPAIAGEVEAVIGFDRRGGDSVVHVARRPLTATTNSPTAAAEVDSDPLPKTHMTHVRQ